MTCTGLCIYDTYFYCKRIVLVKHFKKAINMSHNAGGGLTSNIKSTTNNK